MTGSSRDVLARLSRQVPAAMITTLEAGPGEVVTAAPAASVVLLRDHGGRLETYALHRHTRMPFAAGMVVFPGGRVDPADGVPVPVRRLLDPALRRCAVRETEEETGVRLDEADLWPWAHWITPEIEPRRYDTAFYLAALPEGQQARDISGETWMAEWRAPAELLEAADAGTLALMPPTRSILLELTEFSDVAAALTAARDRLVETVLPRPVQGPDGWVFDYGEG